MVWALSFTVVQKALEEVTVFHLIAYRFALATVLLLPLARGRAGRGWTAETRRDGVVIGVLLFAGFALQTAGLLWTTPSRAAFLTGLSVILVPVIGLFLGRPLRWGPAAGSLLAAAGLWVLYRPEVSGAGIGGFGKGDALTIACAVVFAFYVIVLEGATRRNAMGPLAVVQFGVVAALALPSLVLNPPAAPSGRAVFAVILLGVFATAAAFVAQLYAQRHLSAIEAGVILTLEPVIASAFSVFLGVEPWTAALALGGLLILAAMLVTELGGGPTGTSPPVAGVPRS